MLVVFRNKMFGHTFRKKKILILPFRLFNFILFGYRTSDGGKVVGTIEVSVVKMGEIEDGEADHITTDVQGQKVGSLSAHCKN